MKDYLSLFDTCIYRFESRYNVMEEKDLGITGDISSMLTPEHSVSAMNCFQGCPYTNTAFRFDVITDGEKVRAASWKWLPNAMYRVGEAEGFTVQTVTAVIPGKVGDKKVMIMGHTDTMPIGDPNSWTVNPLGEMKDGRIYGRGSNDNKFGVAQCTFIAKMLQDLNIELDSDLLFTAYSDEEYGGGGGTLSACIGYPCDVFVNTDGGNNELWPVALGGQAMELNITSNELLDSSVPVAEALHIAMKALEPFGERRRNELHQNPHYTGTDMQRSAFRITGFKAGEMGCDLSHGKLQFSYYTDRSREEIYQELGEIEAQIQAQLPALNVETKGFEPMSRFFDYGIMEDSMGVIDAFQRASIAATGKEIPVTASCLTDLNLILAYGSKSALNFGLVRDFKLYGGAHQPDEFVECDQLVDHTKKLALFVLDFCGGHVK